MPLEGQDALDYLNALERESTQIKAENLQLAKREATQAGKETFDHGALRGLVDTSRWSESELEYMYYVDHRQLKTLRAFADLLKQLWFWRD